MDIAADFTQAVANVMTAVLQSPCFLYRWELGPNDPIKDGDLIRFNQHEMASRQSYLFWASMPDDELFAAADDGKLGTSDGIAAEARRLLASPKARVALQDFTLQWLNMAGLADMPKDPRGQRRRLLQPRPVPPQRRQTHQRRHERHLSGLRGAADLRRHLGRLAQDLRSVAARQDEGRSGFGSAPLCLAAPGAKLALRRVRVLLLLDGGQSFRATALAVGGYPREISRVSKRYSSGGLKRALTDDPRLKPAPKLDSAQ